MRWSVLLVVACASPDASRPGASSGDTDPVPPIDTDPPEEAPELPPGQFAYALATESVTSAGVYRGRALVRTLWSNERQPAGDHLGDWDGLDDAGAPATGGPFTVTVLSNDLTIEWEGVIGNTSTATWGPTVIRSLRGFQGLAVWGDTAYYATGYNESETSTFKLDLTAPQAKTDILPTEHGDNNLEVLYVATDGDAVFWGGFDPYDTGVSFVHATDVASDAERIFASGQEVPTVYGRVYPSALDVVEGRPDAHVTGLAVQRSGDFLFVSRRGLGEVHVLDKHTGALVETVALADPRQLAVDGDDHVWLVHGAGTVERFAVDAQGRLTPVGTTISGLRDPLDVAADPAGATVAVVDGGESQQVKGFRVSDGSPLWTLGQPGGYADDPKVADDRFYFDDGLTELPRPFVAFDAQGGLLVGDGGNARIQRFDASRAFVETVMACPMNYNVAVDRSDPTRVFMSFLEFEVDYGLPLSPTNGSWRLARNWRAGLTPDHWVGNFDLRHIFRNVTQLSNGRTYATLNDLSEPDLRYPEIVELPASGNLRFTGERLGVFSLDVLEPDGTLRRRVSTGVAHDGLFEEQALSGFDASGDPLWDSPVEIARTTTIDGDPASDWPSPVLRTDGDVLVVFDAGTANEGWHLGGVAVGGEGYLWITSPATSPDHEGDMPSDGSYDLGNGVEYAGGGVVSAGHVIAWNYIGEFWQDSQTNIWNFYWDNGLMLAQAGVTGPDAAAADGPSAPREMAGNAFSSQLVAVGDDLYLYHNDESYHAGVHRWRISNLGSIASQSSPIEPP